jgi:hypothetical protein
VDLGYALALYRFNRAKLAIGIEEGYNNRHGPKMKKHRYVIKNELKARIMAICGQKVQVHDTLEETIDDALACVNRFHGGAA